MADIVNLRQARKAKRRAEDAAAAVVNRRQHGLSKADRSAAAQEQRRSMRVLEAHRRDAADPDGPA